MGWSMIDRPLYYLVDRKEPEQSPHTSALLAEREPMTVSAPTGGVQQSSHASDRIAVPDQGWFPTASHCEAEKCQITRTPAGLKVTDRITTVFGGYLVEDITAKAGCLE